METKVIMREYLESLTSLDEKSIEIYKKNLFRNEIAECETKLKKEFLEFEPYEIRECIAAFKNQRTNKNMIPGKTALNTILSIYKGFYQYCLDAHIIAGFNIYDMNSLSVKEVYRYLQEKHKANFVPLLRKEEVEQLCVQLSTMKDYYFYEVIVRLAYEGILEYPKDLVEIKASDVNLEHQTIRKGGIYHTISRELSQALYNCAEKGFEGLSNAYTAERINDSYLYFVRKKNMNYLTGEDEKKAIANNISRKIKRVSDLTGREVTFQLLYYSGFYSYLISCVGEEQAHNMIWESENEKNNVKRLESLAESYGFHKAGKRIRFLFTKYFA